MIQSVTNITPSSNVVHNSSNSKFQNRNANENVVSKQNSLNQFSDSFNYSNSKSQVAFKGSPIGLIKEMKLGGVMTRLSEEAKGALGGLVRKLKGHDELPFTEKPMCLYTQRDGNILSYKREALDKLKEMLDNGDISKDTYYRKVREMNNYFDNAQNLPQSVSSRTIDQNKPSFKSSSSSDVDADVDVSDVDDGGVVSGAAGEVAGGVVSTVVEETVGEGVCQFFERALDCFLPGAGVAITAARWGRRGYKVAKFVKKISD